MFIDSDVSEQGGRTKRELTPAKEEILTACLFKGGKFHCEHIRERLGISKSRILKCNESKEVRYAHK